ncbi:MAG: hypothetical protein M0D55_19790 [Elusimicrobiota bacterium]|nr:MAG: hypothetical protein M0D55_19790 [Elusimicrobiota bacterium]
MDVGSLEIGDSGADRPAAMPVDFAGDEDDHGLLLVVGQGPEVLVLGGELFGFRLILVGEILGQSGPGLEGEAGGEEDSQEGFGVHKWSMDPQLRAVKPPELT